MSNSFQSTRYVPQADLMIYADNDVKTNSGILNAVACKLACPGEDN